MLIFQSTPFPPVHALLPLAPHTPPAPAPAPTLPWRRLPFVILTAFGKHFYALPTGSTGRAHAACAVCGVWMTSISHGSSVPVQVPLHSLPLPRPASQASHRWQKFLAQLFLGLRFSLRSNCPLEVGTGTSQRALSYCCPPHSFILSPHSPCHPAGAVIERVSGIY